MRRVILLFSLSIFAILFFAFSGTASAAGIGHLQKSTVHPLVSCYGASCYNLDPYQTGCSSGAYVATTDNVYVGKVLEFVIDNWYSPGCAANWNVTTLVHSGVDYITIQNSNGEYSCEYEPGTACGDVSYINTSPVWTNMVDGTVKAQACAVAALAGPDSDNKYCGNWV